VHRDAPANDGLAAARLSPMAILLDMNLPDYSDSECGPLKRNRSSAPHSVHVVSVARLLAGSTRYGRVGYAMKP